MRGIDHHQSDMFSYLSPEQLVRKDHLLRIVWTMTDEILEQMSPLFDGIYAEGGRPSVRPEKLAAGTPFADAVFGGVGASADRGD